MATHWTIERGGQEKSLADWGVVSARMTFRNQMPDELVVGVDGAFDGAGVWSYDDEIILRRGREWNGSAWSGGTVHFRGWVTGMPRLGQGGGEFQQYVVSGPWVWLDEIVFGQNWSHSGAGQLRTSHLLLNWGLRTDQQIAQAVQAAINSGAPIQIGTIDQLTSVPASEVRDLTCGEVIRQQLRWSPDAVCWFDYSTNPPTFHCRRWVNLAEKNIALWDGRISDANIVPRHDLVLPGVLLNYELTEEVDGVAKLKLVQDRYPPTITGFERGCLVATFDLQGARIRHAISEIVTEPIQASSATSDTRLGWWKRACPELADTRVTDLSIPTADVKFYDAEGNLITWDTYGLTNELVEGEITPWMEREYDAEYERVTVTARATFKIRDGSSNEVVAAEKMLSVELVATNMASGMYSTIESAEEGEAPPVGLAEFLYNTHQVLHYEGTMRVNGAEVQGDLRPGQRLNIQGGAGTYAAMRAAIQEAREDLMTGATEVTFGPPAQLGPADIIEWLRAFRTRRVWTNPATQRSGELGSEGRVESGKIAPRKNSLVGNENFARIVIRELSGGGYLDLNRADLNGKQVKIRELDYCDSGTLKKIMVVASEPYTPS